MDAIDIQKLQNIAYVNSQIASSLIELEAMKAENMERSRHNLAQAYIGDDFIRLVDRYQLGHNSVLTNLQNGI